MLGLLKPLLSKQPHRLGEMFTVMCLLNSCLMFSKIMNLYVVGLKYYVRYFLAWRAIFVIRCFALFTAEMKKSFKNIFPLKMSTGWRHLLLSRRRRRKCRFHFPEEGFSFWSQRHRQFFVSKLTDIVDNLTNAICLILNA